MGTATIYLLFIVGITIYIWSLRHLFGSRGSRRRNVQPDEPREALEAQSPPGWGTPPYP